jgi:hypothetical protein
MKRLVEIARTVKRERPETSTNKRLPFAAEGGALGGGPQHIPSPSQVWLGEGTSAIQDVRRKTMHRLTGHPCPNFLGKVYGLLLYGI